MNYCSDREHGSSGPGAENTSTSLFPNWDQTYDHRITDCSLHMGYNTSVSANYNDYSLPQYTNPNNDWPSLPQEEPFLPEDLADLQIQGLGSGSPWHECAPEGTLFPVNWEDSLTVSPPVAEHRNIHPYSLPLHSNNVNYNIATNTSPSSSFNTYCPQVAEQINVDPHSLPLPSNNVYYNIVSNTSPSSSLNTYCSTSPADSRLSPGTEDDNQLHNDQGLGLTKDGRPRKRRPKKSLLNLTEEEKRAHEREVNSGSTARYRKKRVQQRETLEQQLQQETERKAALEQLFHTKTTELAALKNEFYGSTLYPPQ